MGCRAVNLSFSKATVLTLLRYVFLYNYNLPLLINKKVKNSFIINKAYILLNYNVLLYIYYINFFGFL